ncbi:MULTISPECIES: hypothetical protein [Flavobacterium]|uniref:hypothetical protein n=1 Tax=Flavobacterium TaxID=237 RepID=UPI001FCB8EBE|nr:MULTISPECIES: hypothetical protein [Flavobacterium]UOK41315.1 hypothetical protein LZF87_08260 [Flavobacterium enshiense]
MKKVFLLLVVYVLVLSCGTKHYVLNTHSKPRPTSQFKFKVDKNKSMANVSLVIDTNAIYINSAFRRMKPEVSDLYYRFMPDGVVYEVVLSGDPVDSTVKDTAVANYGRYKLKKNKIKMEFIVVQMGSYEKKNSTSKKAVVGRRFQKAVIKEGDLFLVPHYYSEAKEFYSNMWGLFGTGFGFFACLIVPPVFLVDAVIPDKKVCFHRVGLNEIKNYKKKDTISK